MSRDVVAVDTIDWWEQNCPEAPATQPTTLSVATEILEDESKGLDEFEKKRAKVPPEAPA